MPYGYWPSNAAHNLEEDASSQALETNSIAADSITAEGMAAHNAMSTPLGASQSFKNLYLGTDACPVLVLAQELVYMSTLSCQMEDSFTTGTASIPMSFSGWPTKCLPWCLCRMTVRSFLTNTQCKVYYCSLVELTQDPVICQAVWFLFLILPFASTV